MLAILKVIRDYIQRNIDKKPTKPLFIEPKRMVNFLTFHMVLKRGLNEL